MHTVSPVKETRNYLRMSIFVVVGLMAIPLLIFFYSIVQELMVRAEDLLPQKVQVNRITRSSAVITWYTPHATQSIIEYGTTPESLISYAPETEATRDHHVELTLLTSSTSYYFQIRTGDTVYDQNGIPWSFITKSPTGEDVSDQVRGISTRIRESSRPRASATPTIAICDVTTCAEIQRKLGKGCTTSDYVKCIATTPARSPTPTSLLLSGYATLTPTPPATTPGIISSRCKPTYLYADTSSTKKCSRWVWERLDASGKPSSCREDFDHYVLECKANSFVPTPGATLAPEKQYFNGSITDITHNAASLDVVPDAGQYVFCQVKAVDVDGYSTDWYQGSAKCE